MKSRSKINDLNVKKANYLVPFEERMSKASQLCVSFLISALPRSTVQNGFPALSFTFKEIKKAVNADGKRRITEVKDLWNINSELMSVPLWYENDEKQGMVSWMTEIEQDKRTDDFTYFFHPKLERHLLNLKSKYTLYNYYYRVCLSRNAMKLYEILKMHEYTGRVELDIEKDIKAPLGLNGKYSAYYDLKRKVINPIQGELKKFSDIQFEYVESKKNGRKVLSLEFEITPNHPTNLPKPLRRVLEEQRKAQITAQLSIEDELETDVLRTNYPNIYELLTEWRADPRIITHMIRKHGAERVRHIINYVKYESEQDNWDWDNLDFFLQGIESTWMDPKKREGMQFEMSLKN